MMSYSLTAPSIMWTRTTNAVESKNLVPEFDQPQYQWQKVINQLIQVRRYGPDWDGEGAAPPDKFLVDLALRIVTTLRKGGAFEKDGKVCFDLKEWLPLDPPVRVAATPEGNVILEWQMNGDYLEAEIEDDGRVECMYSRPGERTKFYSFEFPPKVAEPETTLESIKTSQAA